MKNKKTGIATNTIINPKLERNIKKRKEKLKKLNTCSKCKHFNKKNMWCTNYKFIISTIEIGLKCKSFNKKI